MAILHTNEPTRSGQYAVISMTKFQYGLSEPCRRNIEHVQQAALNHTSRGPACHVAQWHHAVETQSLNGLKLTNMGIPARGKSLRQRPPAYRMVSSPMATLSLTSFRASCSSSSNR